MTLPADTRWLHDPDVQAVCRSLDDQAFFVGGCVRDAVLGIAGADVDLSTPLRPEIVTEKARDAGLKVVPTGIEHGTVTVVSGGKGFEVTSFRRDVQTDGRRAVVSFSTDMAEDARRRDFTMNALYADPQGRVIDPLGGGLQDCLDRRVRFIEDADRRIREDYLRILRFFRFTAWYAAPDRGFDPEALDAIARNVEGLGQLSAERVGGELTRMLAAPDPAAAVAIMRQTGCLAAVLPGSDDSYLAASIHVAQSMGHAPDPMLRLAALGGQDVAARLRLSRAQARELEAIVEAGYGAVPLTEVAYRKGAQIALAAAALRAAVASRPVASDCVDKILEAAEARFPVTARDLMPALTGKALGCELARLESRWIASGFRLTREDLLKKG